MVDRTKLRRVVLAVLGPPVLAGSVLVGCAGESADTPFRGLDRAERRVSNAGPAGPSDAPPARVNGQAISWAQLDPLLAEASGGVVLEEVALDRLLHRQLSQAGLTLTDQDRADEQQRLVDTLTMTGSQTTTEQMAVFTRLRTDRGLGDRRLALLLDRNAMLRKLVADQITVTDDEITQAYEITHGQRYLVRLILTDTLANAQDARRQVIALGGDPGAAFSAVAVERSGHSSAARGGLIGPISPADPANPQAIRQALPTLSATQPSPVLSLPNGFAVLMLESRIAPTGVPLASVEASLRRQVRLGKERSAMRALANRLVREASITVYDPSLRWSWQARQGGS